MKPCYEGKVQLLYVNKRIIARGMIHKIVNDFIDHYTKCFSSMLGSQHTLILKNSKHILKNVFIIQIKCPWSCYEVFSNIRKCTVEFENSESVLKCIKKAVKKSFNESCYRKSSNHETFKPEILKESIHQSKRGASLLINVIKGMPAKRKYSPENNKELLDVDMRNDTSKNKNKTDIEYSIKNSSKNLKSIDCYSNDSLESPIPKKLLKHSIVTKSKIRVEFSAAKKNLNESYLQFYYGMKKHFNYDKNADEEYKTCKHFRQRRKSYITQDITKSFIEPEAYEGKLIESEGTKLRFHDVASSKFVEINQASSSKENKRVCKNRILPYNTDINPYVTLKDPNHYRDCNAFQKFYHNHIDSVLNVTKCNNFRVDKHVSSPAPSEVLFINFMKFRNFEGLDRDFADSLYAHSEKNHSQTSTKTWASHFENSMYDDYTKNKFLDDLILKNNAKSLKSSFCRKEYGSFLGVTEPSITSVPKKVDAVAQTESNCLYVTCSGSAEDGIVESLDFKQSSDFSIKSNSNNDEDKRKRLCSEEPIQKTSYEKSLYSPRVKISKKEGISEKEPNKKNLNLFCTEASSLSEVINCGQKTKSQPNSLVQSIVSKETISSALINCLEEMQNDTQISESLIPLDSNGFKTDSAHLTQTIPIEDLEIDSKASNETDFIITDRHNFMPKGFSPKYQSKEAFQIPSLSLPEQSKLKLTIDNSENKLLTSVKWQDECNGNLVFSFILIFLKLFLINLFLF